jgi:transposase-like protein
MRVDEPPRHQGVCAPLQCPFCRSSRVLTTSKLVDDATYWRCEACGQIWNPARLLGAPVRPKSEPFPIIPPRR